ncbi:MAG: hypothetical protein ABR529_06505 [Actinomycetota bacterium]
MNVVTMRWEAKLLERVDAAAKAAGMTRSDWVRFAVETALRNGKPLRKPEAPAAVKQPSSEATCTHTRPVDRNRNPNGTSYCLKCKRVVGRWK